MGFVQSGIVLSETNSSGSHSLLKNGLTAAAYRLIILTLEISYVCCFNHLHQPHEAIAHHKSTCRKHTEAGRVRFCFQKLIRRGVTSSTSLERVWTTER